MKTIKNTGAFLFLFASLFLASCSGDDSNDNVNPDPEQPGELVLVAIDTAKVIVMTETGSDQTVVLDRLQNSNSYFGGLSISPDGTKAAYSDYQMTGTWPDQVRTRQIRVVNTDGSNDHLVYESEAEQVHFEAVTFCANNKIFFAEVTSFPDLTRTLQLINADGTGLETLSGQYNVAAISSDMEYFLLNATPNQDNPAVQIIDRDGDAGAGSLYHNESFAGEDPYSIGEGMFTNNGKLAVIPYRSGADAKIRVINMETKTATTVTLVSGITAQWYTCHVAMASDSNRGVCTIAGDGMAKSKSYVFNLSEGTVAAPFENNDNNVMQVYIH